jgi:hypothetical protein
LKTATAATCSRIERSVYPGCGRTLNILPIQPSGAKRVRKKRLFFAAILKKSKPIFKKMHEVRSN